MAATDSGRADKGETRTGRAAVAAVFGERAVVATTSLLFGLGFGLNFAVSNQNTYLLQAVRLSSPDTFTRDWLTTQTTPYHRLFAYPTAALLYLDSSGWLLAAANILLLAFGGVVIFGLIRRIVAATQELLSLMLVLLLALATHTLSVAESTLYTLVYEPSTVGVAGFLLGMYFFVSGRYLLSGLAIAAGGLFHANYLLLAFPAFGLAHLLLRRDRTTRSLLAQFAFPALALLVLLPFVASVALDPGSAGTDILLSIRSPHHYQPSHFHDQFVPFVGWLLLLAASFRRTDVRSHRPALALAASLFGLVALASFLTTFVYVSWIARLYVWRLAPLAVLLAQVFTTRMVASAVAGPHARPAAHGHGGAANEAWLLPFAWRVGLVAAAAGCFLYYYAFRHLNRLVLEVFGAILLLALVGWGRKSWPTRAGRWGRKSWPTRAGRWGRKTRTQTLPGRASARTAKTAVTGSTQTSVATAVLFAALALALLAGKGLAEDSSLLGKPTAESRLYAWARTTEKDAVFLIPPDLEQFRLLARHAVVVDWKSTPFAASELEEWYRRIDAVSGRVHPRGEAEATAGYAALNSRRLANLADLYIASYVVLRKPVNSTLPTDWQPAFENERYRVLKTRIAVP